MSFNRKFQDLKRKLIASRLASADDTDQPLSDGDKTSAPGMKRFMANLETEQGAGLISEKQAYYSLLINSYLSNIKQVRLDGQQFKLFVSEIDIDDQLYVFLYLNAFKTTSAQDLIGAFYGSEPIPAKNVNWKMAERIYARYLRAEGKEKEKLKKILYGFLRKITVGYKHDERDQFILSIEPLTIDDYFFYKMTNGGRHVIALENTPLNAEEQPGPFENTFFDQLFPLLNQRDTFYEKMLRYTNELNALIKALEHDAQRIRIHRFISAVTAFTLEVKQLQALAEENHDKIISGELKEEVKNRHAVLVKTAAKLKRIAFLLFDQGKPNDQVNLILAIVITTLGLALIGVGFACIILIPAVTLATLFAIAITTPWLIGGVNIVLGLIVTFIGQLAIFKSFGRVKSSTAEATEDLLALLEEKEKTAHETLRSPYIALNYKKKYDTLLKNIKSGKLPISDKISALINFLNKALIAKSQNYKTVFYEVVFALCHPQAPGHLIETLKAINVDDEDAGDGTSAKLITDEESMLVFLVVTSMDYNLLSRKELKDFLHPFYKKDAAQKSDTKELKRYCWLIANNLHAQYLVFVKPVQMDPVQFKTRQKFEEILIGYLSNKTHIQAANITLDVLKQFPYLILPDIILHRMTHIGRDNLDVDIHGSSQNNFLDAMHRLMKYVQYPQRGRSGNPIQHKLIDQIKPIFARLSAKDQLEMTAFFNRLAKFEQNIHQLTRVVEQAAAGQAAFPDLNAADCEEMIASAVKYIKGEAGALLQEARRFFDECMPGTLKYQILGIAMIILGLGILTGGILALALPALFVFLGAGFVGSTIFTAAAGTGIGVGGLMTLFGGISVRAHQILKQRSQETTKQITATAESEINTDLQKVTIAAEQGKLNLIPIDELQSFEPENVDNDPTVVVRRR